MEVMSCLFNPFNESEKDNLSCFYAVLVIPIDNYFLLERGSKFKHNGLEDHCNASNPLANGLNHFVAEDMSAANMEEGKLARRREEVTGRLAWVI